MKTAVFAAMLAATFALIGLFGTPSVWAGEGTKDKAAKADSKAAAGEVTLKGDMVCAKCALKQSEKCQNVLKVADGGKETLYYLEHNQIAKDNHEMVCSGKPKSATVTGMVKEAGGKKLLIASSIKYQ
jgi:hypothetical protein